MNTIIKVLFHILTMFGGIIESKTTTNITIFAISNLNSPAATAAVGAQWLAIQEINNNSQLLPNYTLNLQVFDSGTDSQTALIEALNIIQYESTNNHIYFPILLGCPWSSLSIAINPVLGAFNRGQISAAATSISLSDTNKYPYFYRTIPSDGLQAEGLILLCNTFNWTAIVIVYVNDAYGLHLSIGIQELAKKHNIEAVSIAVTFVNDVTYNYAAKQIKDFGIYIIILIIHDGVNPFTAFEQEGILRYPYYYLGCDGWLEDATIHSWNAQSKTQGIIGTVPWQTHSLDIHEYSKDKINVVNKSISILDNILKLWSFYYNNGYNESLYVELPTSASMTIYGYDALYTLAYSLQKLGNIEDISIQALNDIITNDIDFIGATGHVTYDENGDRIDGLYSFGNILSDGNGTSMDYFGYFYQDIDGEIISQIDIDKIVFPDYFTEKGMIPRSTILIHEKIVNISSLAGIIMFILLFNSLIIALMFVTMLMYYKKNIIIKAASWRLNIIMCIGAILSYLCAILYGIDEAFVSRYILNIICNIRLWILCISFTILFMPLFMKTYRLSRLFNTILTKKEVTDQRLLKIIGICILIDIILLTIFTWMKLLTRIYVNGSLETMDELQQIQYKYGTCSFNASMFENVLFYGILLFWKLCELIFGFHVTLNVSRIKDVTNMLGRFDETGIQILSIAITFIILSIVIPIFLFGPTQIPSYFYLVISGTTVLIGNIVLALNLLPRIIAVFKHKEDKYGLSPGQRIEAKLKKRFAGMSIPEPSSISTPRSTNVELAEQNVSV